MPATTEELRRKLAALALEKVLTRAPHNLDPTFAELAASRNAEMVTHLEEGDPDPSSVASVAVRVAEGAPAKFRAAADAETDAGADAGQGGTFYDTLRAAVAARHAQRATGGIDALISRAGSPPRREA